jgi:hypothetical protein
LGLCLFAPVSAADFTGNATRDAERLVVCMKSFDAKCVVTLTYVMVFEDRGITDDELALRMTDMYQKLRFMGATYSSFELATAWKVILANGRYYIFIPYSAVVDVDGQKTSQQSFLLGVSEDSGISWKFVDGASVTQDNVVSIIPGYSGPLPPKSLNQSGTR